MCFGYCDFYLFCSFGLCVSYILTHIGEANYFFFHVSLGFDESADSLHPVAVTKIGKPHNRSSSSTRGRCAIASSVASFSHADRLSQHSRIARELQIDNCNVENITTIWASDDDAEWWNNIDKN